LAVDVQYQGKRLGELLLMDAVRRVRLIQEHAGVVGLFVDAIYLIHRDTLRDCPRGKNDTIIQARPDNLNNQ